MVSTRLHNSDWGAIDSTIQVTLSDSGWHIYIAGIYWVLVLSHLIDAYISWLDILAWHISNMAYSSFIILQPVLVYDYICIIFWESIRVLQWWVSTFDIEMVLKSFVFAHSRFLFCAPPGLAVKVRIDEDYWRISSLVATVEGIILAHSSVFTYARKSRVRWVRSSSRAHSDV